MNPRTLEIIKEQLGITELPAPAPTEVIETTIDLTKKGDQFETDLDSPSMDYALKINPYNKT